MAALPEADLRAILGDEYATLIARETARTVEPNTPAERRRALAYRLEANETGRISAGAVGFTGFLLTLGSLYRTGGVDIAGMIGIAGFVIGLVWYVWLVRSAAEWRRKLQP